MDVSLHNVRSPVFSVDSAGDGRVCLVTAGGGAAKTGIKNVVSLVAWEADKDADVVQSRVLHTFDTGQEIVFATTVSDDGTVLATMLEGNVELFAWSRKPDSTPSAMRKLGVISVPSGNPSCLAFGRGRTLAIGGEDGSVHLYDTTDSERPTLLHTIKDASQVQAVVWSPSGKLLAACHKNGSTHVISVASLTHAGVPYHTLPSQGAAIIGDSVAGASRSRRSMSAGPPQAMGAAWDDSESSLYVLESTTRGGAALVKWVLGTPQEAGSKAKSTPGYSGNGSAPDATVWHSSLIRRASRTPLTCIKHFTTGPAQRLLIGTSDGGVQCWSASHLSLQWERPALHGMSVSGLAILAGGTAGVSGSPDWSLAHFPLTAPKTQRSRAFIVFMWIVLLAALVAAWLLLAEHAQRALEPKGAEL